MGASRKLQSEIDRVLKKVQEGVELFDSIWNKVYDTDNANQKDKYEAELKKEIKKLQRYRDQIKTWIQSSEIKDKKVSASYEQSLLDARKQIEREMERFKICEKETKTKAFSKEGLGQQPKTDPKEKAKAETRDWINNVVGELESQVDNFEAEIEGLTVKKGKNRPPRLTHLETSITRHKAHIMKLELILRLLDNDQLSPEQVNDVKDFLEDYVERNQDDFDEFSDVDELYETLPLDKVEALEDLVAIGQPSLVKGGAVLKTPVDLSSSQMLAAVTPEQSTSPLEQLEGLTSMDNGVPSTASKSSLVSNSSVTNFIPVNVSSQLPGTPASIPVCGRGIIGSDGAYISSSSLNITTEDDSLNLPGRWASSSVTENGFVEGIGIPNITGQSDNLPLNSETAVVPGHGLGLGAIPLASDNRKSKVFGADEKLLSSGMLQSTPTYSINNWVPQSSNSVDRTGSADSSYVGYPPVAAGGSFTSFMAPGMLQWKPGFQNLNEMGQFRGRTEIAPDQREKFLQRFQQVQQQGPSNLLGMQTLGRSNSIQATRQQHNPLLQQSSALPFEVGLAPGLNVPTPASFEQPCISIHPQAAQHRYLLNGPKHLDSVHFSAEEQNLADALTVEVSPAPRSVTASFIDVGFKASRRMGFSLGQPGGFEDNLGVSTSSTDGWPQDYLYNYKMLESALYKLPQPRDSELLRSYTPRRPAVTPPSYPQVQAPVLSDPDLWNRIGSMHQGYDTLFFAFYYQQNTYQQYMAAKALMKQAWRFHRKFNTWFQRHKEPVEATDDYEKGSYVYFDFNVGSDDHGWCQRMKQDFTFEYSYLEDELAV